MKVFVSTHEKVKGLKTWKKRSPWAILLPLGLLFAVACGGAATTIQSTGNASTSSSSSDDPLAPSFTLPLYNGAEFVGGADTITISDLKGKALVLNFWAPLCPPCRAEMPEFQALWEEIQDQDVLIIGVDVGPFTGLGNKDQAIDFLQKINITYPTGRALSGQVIPDYGVFGMPTTAFITKEGRVARTWIGALNREKLSELTLELLQ